MNTLTVVVLLAVAVAMVAGNADLEKKMQEAKDKAETCGKQHGVPSDECHKNTDCSYCVAEGMGKCDENGNFKGLCAEEGNKATGKKEKMENYQECMKAHWEKKPATDQAN